MELCLKKNIKIQPESTIVVPEESVELRVRRVRMDREGIEPVRKVESSDRELHSIFGGNLNVLGQARIEGEEAREAGVIGIGSSHIILLDIPQGVRKAGSILQQGQNSHLPRQ